MGLSILLKSEDKVYIACSSINTIEPKTAYLKNNICLWHVNDSDNAVMTYSGNVRDACAVRTMNKIVTRYDEFRDYIDYDYVVRKIVPDIIDNLKKHHFLKDESYFDNMETEFLFGYKDKGYHIATDGCVMEIDDFICIGSAAPEAIGSLSMTIGQDPVERIKKAYLAAMRDDRSVIAPVFYSVCGLDGYNIIEL